MRSGRLASATRAMDVARNRRNFRKRSSENLAMRHSYISGGNSSLYILIYHLILCLTVTTKPSGAIAPFSTTLGEFDCDFNPVNHGRFRVQAPRRGDNGFSVKVEGQPEFYQPEKTYTVTLRSTYPVTFRGFVLSAQKVGNGSSPAGSFKILSPWTTRTMNHPCSHAVTHATKGKRVSAQFVWTAPPAGFGCVQIRASVIQKGTIWFRDDGDLSQEICEAPAETLPDDRVECCACGSATYRMTFYGLWSPQTHPKNYPEYSTHWSNVIGASHNDRYIIWDYGEYASDGVKKVAEWGWPNAVEDEIRGQGDSVLSVIKTRAQWPAYQPRNIREPPSSVFSVDAGRHLVSLLTMLGPSPDWNVGITKESMCTAQCGWQAERVYDLTPWDAGTDGGVSYMSPNSPTDPPDKIRALTSQDDPESPFYDPAGGPIPPVARVVLSRLSITGDQCGPSQPTNDGSSETIDTASPSVDVASSSNQQSSCIYSKWSDWSACEVTCGWGIKVRSKMLKVKLVPSATCESPLMEKEICRGSEHCENEDQSTVCLYSDWTDWSQCTETCGKDALRFRTRTLQWPSEETNCHEPLKEMNFDCHTGPCNIDLEECRYDEWSDWMPCSAQCGVGQTLRKRFARGQDHCESPEMETSKCMASVDCSLPAGFVAPQGCVYSPWTGWMPCPVTCGVGQTFRKRTLDSSRPDTHCEEVQMETSKCMTSESCSEVVSRGGAATNVCQYSDWTDWMPCSQSCDVGKTLRKRFLTAPHGTCEEIEMETVPCYMPPCSAMKPGSGKTILDGTDKRCIYGPWTAWMPCSVTCGTGETLRKRFLVKSLDISRICEEFEMETNRCTVPVSCSVEEETNGGEAGAVHEGRGSEWSACSVTCGRGMRSRTQTVTNCDQRSEDECTYTETEECASRNRCPIDCVLEEWSEWSPCPPCKSTINRRHLNARREQLPSTSQQMRSRRRLTKPRYGGRRCGPRRERRKCLCE